jgi:hypothetical protein
MSERALRDLRPGDVVNLYGARRIVADVAKDFDPHGYPLRVVTFADDGKPLTHNATYTVDVVERVREDVAEGLERLALIRQRIADVRKLNERTDRD